MQTLTRLLSLACLLALGVSATADDKKPDSKAWPYTGTWERTGPEGVDITLQFTSEKTLNLKATVGDAVLKMKCKYTLDKKTQLLKVDATEIKTDGDFPLVPSDGWNCTFKFTVNKEKTEAKMTDFKAEEHSEQTRDVVEGDYKAKKAD